jgi:acylphosphatase
VPTCRRFKVSGRVQGVGFRAATLAEAERLHLTGWVRNAANGDVEVLVCGERESIEVLGRWLWRGPRSARVSAVDMQEAPIEAFEVFEVR